MEGKIALIDVGYDGHLGLWEPLRGGLGHLLTFNPLIGSFSNLKHTHVHAAVSENPGVREFNVLHKHACSSLFDVDESILAQRGKDPADLELEKRVKVTYVRLDDTLDSGSVVYRYLKIDTQGSDLSVIKSLGEYLETMWCVQAEVFFTRFYVGAPMAVDVCDYMNDNGFRLAGNARKHNPLFGDFVFINKNAPEESLEVIRRVYGSGEEMLI